MGLSEYILELLNKAVTKKKPQRLIESFKIAYNYVNITQIAQGGQFVEAHPVIRVLARVLRNYHEAFKSQTVAAIMHCSAS